MNIWHTLNNDGDASCSRVFDLTIMSIGMLLSRGEPSLANRASAEASEPAAQASAGSSIHVVSNSRFAGRDDDLWQKMVLVETKPSEERLK